MRPLVLADSDASGVGQDDWEHRVCVEPMDDRRFGPKTTVGVCNHARPKKRATVVWALVRDQQRWAERNGVSPVSGREAA